MELHEFMHPDTQPSEPSGDHQSKPENTERGSADQQPSPENAQHGSADQQPPEDSMRGPGDQGVPGPAAAPTGPATVAGPGDATLPATEAGSLEANRGSTLDPQEPLRNEPLGPPRRNRDLAIYVLDQLEENLFQKMEELQPQMHENLAWDMWKTINQWVHQVRKARQQLTPEICTL